MARRYASDADRRARDREIQRLAANRRVGHDHAYLILYGLPTLRVIVPLVLLAAGAVWVWFNIDHKLIGFVAVLAGGTMVLLYGVNTYAATGPQARQMSRATGRPTRPAWWHAVGLAGAVLLALAYVVTPR
jgi:hypothetical protein